jgi:hypothetical protein
MELINALSPDYFAALSDEVLHKASHRRVVVSVDRSLQWLDQCITVKVWSSSVLESVRVFNIMKLISLHPAVLPQHAHMGHIF